MDAYDDTKAEEVHAALAEVIPLDDGEILTGWIIVYETVSSQEVPNAGHLYGPATMTTWGAMGLIEWARSRTLPEALDLSDDEDGDE